jgi:protoheme IX farnesyltransferase
MAGVSALMGYILAARAVTPEAIAPLAGVIVLACGSGALNQYQERDLDAQMVRTRSRPIPSGRLSPGRALAVAIALLVLGAVLLSGNGTAVALGIVTVFWYNGVYTPLKRVSALAAIPGGVVGSLPPVIGFVSAGGDPFAPVIVAVAFFFFVWQVPHFWLLLMRIGEDYERAGMPTLSALLSRRQLSRLIYVWMLATGVTCMVIPIVLAPALWVHVALLAASVWLVWHATRMLRSQGRFLAFREINVYALVVMGLLSVSGLLR